MGFTIYTGPMHSAKTLGLINELLKINYRQGIDAIAFKPDIDLRHDPHNIVAFNKSLSYPASSIPINQPELILKKLNGERVVAIDEIQFFDTGIVKVVETLLDQNRHVIAAGLNLDFRGETFGSMGELLARADNIVVNHAYCTFEGCQEPAYYTQKMIRINDVLEPAPYNSEQVEVGDHCYEVRCKEHHIIPGKSSSS